MTDTSPISTVLYNEVENITFDGLYDTYLTIYMHKEIGKKLSISFDDFIDRPKYEIESIIRIVDEVDKQKAKINKEVLEELEGNDK